jgi:hypothetical protein
MSFYRLAAFILSVWLTAFALPAQAQRTFISGDAGVALIGPPLVSLDQGAVSLTSRIGFGAEFDRFQVEFDAGIIALPGIEEGFLLVPSLDGSYLFRSPDTAIRPYIGGGLDLVYVVSEYGGFGLPWAHLTFGVDSALNERTSFYVEGRTYGLETQVSLGSKYRF